MIDSEKIIIYKINKFSDETYIAIKELAQLIGNNYKTFSESDFKEILKINGYYLYVAQHKSTGKIVGMVVLLVYRIPYVKKAYMEDLVVSNEFRGQGLGTKLIETVINQARNDGAAYLDFTSRMRRASNDLYFKLGFNKRDTNVYRYVFDYAEV